MVDQLHLMETLVVIIIQEKHDQVDHLQQIHQAQLIVQGLAEEGLNHLLTKKLEGKGKIRAM